MSDLADVLHQHQVLRDKMPHAWNPFFARFGSLRAVQLAAIPPILAGHSTLVTAPTAGGKTEAIAAPICERLARFRWPGLSVLLITPTRALVNDLYARLDIPMGHMGIGLGRKTSDHSNWNNPRLQFLVTTPESTESLLTFNRSALDNLQAVAIDEVHLLDGTPRGDQLRIVLQRLSRYLRYLRGDCYLGLQRVAMSATVADPALLAIRFLGEGAQIVSVPGQRSIEAKIVTAIGDDELRIQAAVEALDDFVDARKLLVFVNSRRQVDVSTSYFQHGRFRDFPVFGHHGNLSKETRESTEGRFKAEERAICVSTMTLEVGIDIGDVDLVVCLDPPFSLSSFLQRIGRGCRRLQGKTRVLCVARDAAGELIFRALVNQAAIGMPRGPRIPFRRSVLLQQILAYLRQVEKNRRTVQQLCETLGYADTLELGEEGVLAVLEDMVSNGYLDRDKAVIRPATSGWDFIGSSKIFSNMAPAPMEPSVVDAHPGQLMVSVDGVDRKAGGVRIAGKSYELLGRDSRGLVLVRSGGEFVSGPGYRSATLPYAFDIGASIASLLEIQSSHLVCLRCGDELAVFTWLGKLLNSALKVGLRATGVDASAKPFHLLMKLSDVGAAIPVIKKGVENACQVNPYRDIAVERIVDLGPYFGLLTPQLQTRCREDWLDHDFLRKWCESLISADETALDSRLGHLLSCLY